MKLTLPVLILLHFKFIESARILAVFPAPSVSHQVVFRVLTHELARLGHEVVVITPNPVFPKEKNAGKLIEIDVHDLSYTKWNNIVSVMEDGSRDCLQQVKIMKNAMYEIFKAQVKSESVQEILSNKADYFDLLLLEAGVRPAIGFSHVFKALVILVSSFGGILDNYEVTGSPTHPILYPSLIRDRVYNLSKWEKITELIKEFKSWLMTRNYEIDYKVLKELFGDDVPSFEILYENIAMMFLNMHPIWDDNRPVSPSVIYMGGIHQIQQKDLPKDFKSYLDSSKNGVIYFSLGTNVKPYFVPSEKLQAIINVFSKLPYDVLWKWDNELSGLPNNIRISKWLPQADLLRHPNIKLFITQGGLQSTDEAIHAGVPLVGIPLLGDQWYNVEKYVHHKIGKRIDIDTMTEESFDNALQTVINDTSYRENIVRLRSIMLDQPQSPLERAVWWTEHVLRHAGARHLRSPAANISWTQYLELELVFSLTAVLIVSLIFVILVLKVIWSFIFQIGFTDKIKKA